ncbi:MAG: MBL fold metallo-hydrolase [Labilithrix sp.]|nr:MBL fold metallo-hydrolase [Labilithrix sp.]
MDWHCLGHAMWLAEVDGLRLLFDPLLDDAHHGGVFEVYPPRRIDAAALRADFVFVSHRHPDHFDLASLRRLAALDPDSVVVTSDDLVASVAHRLGFRAVRVVAPETTIDLDGPRLVTAPSRGASEPEWGVVVANADGIVYDQIDTEIGAPADVRAFFGRVAKALGRDAGGLVTLALARWQPLLEVEAMLAGPIGFPFRAYADELERCAAIGARAVCPSSAGTRHAGPHAFMNRLVYPVTETRFLEDAAARMPGTRLFGHRTGATYRVAGGDVSVDATGAIDTGLVASLGTIDDPRVFRPLEIPPIVDPNLDARPEEELRERAATWIAGALVPSLERAAGRRRLRYVLEVVLPRTVDVYTVTTGGPVTLTRDDHLDWDVRCAVAGSFLVDVIEARRHWGELLLGGMLRAASRACEVDVRGLRAIPLQPLFVYEALSYEESIRRVLDRG